MGSAAVVRSTPRRDGPSLSRAEPWPSFPSTLIILIRPSPSLLNPCPTRLSLQPLLPLPRTWLGSASPHRAHAGATDQIEQPRHGVLPVAILRAILPRGNDDHAVAGQPRAGQRLQARLDFIG